MKKLRVWSLWIVFLIVLGSLMVYVSFTGLIRGEDVTLPAIGLAFSVLCLGTISLYSADKKEWRDTSSAQATIDWYLTDACLYFSCQCTPEEVIHADLYTMGSVKCPSCDKLWRLPTVLRLKQKGPHE